jgi:hypothetical protein
MAERGEKWDWQNEIGFENLIDTEFVNGEQAVMVTRFLKNPVPFKRTGQEWPKKSISLMPKLKNIREKAFIALALS